MTDRGSTFIKVPIAGDDIAAAIAEARAIAAERLHGDDVLLAPGATVADGVLSSTWTGGVNEEAAARTATAAAEVERLAAPPAEGKSGDGE